MSSEGPIDVTPAAVLVAVSERFDLPVGAIVGKGRLHTVALARHVAMWFCRCRLVRSSSYPELGRAFGGRDHTTVMSAVAKVARLVAEDDPEVLLHVVAVERLLRPGVRFRIADVGSP